MLGLAGFGLIMLCLGVVYCVYKRRLKKAADERDENEKDLNNAVEFSPTYKGGSQKETDAMAYLVFV